MKKAVIILVLALFGCVSDKMPVANFEINTPSGKFQKGTYVFDNLSINADTYFWEFGDESFSEEKSPKHRYKQLGDYDVTLTVTNANGIDKKTIILFYE